MISYSKVPLPFEVFTVTNLLSLIKDSSMAELQLEFWLYHPCLHDENNLIKCVELISVAEGVIAL